MVIGMGKGCQEWRVNISAFIWKWRVRTEVFSKPLISRKICICMQYELVSPKRQRITIKHIYEVMDLHTHSDFHGTSSWGLYINLVLCHISSSQISCMLVLGSK